MSKTTKSFISLILIFSLLFSNFFSICPNSHIFAREITETGIIYNDQETWCQGDAVNVCRNGVINSTACTECQEGICIISPTPTVAPNVSSCGHLESKCCRTGPRCFEGNPIRQGFLGLGGCKCLLEGENVGILYQNTGCRYAGEEICRNGNIYKCELANEGFAAKNMPCYSRHCMDNIHCSESPIPAVCEPGHSKCQLGQILICNAEGTTYKYNSTCILGCLGDDCVRTPADFLASFGLSEFSPEALRFALMASGMSAAPLITSSLETGFQAALPYLSNNSIWLIIQEAIINGPTGAYTALQIAISELPPAIQAALGAVGIVSSWMGLYHALLKCVNDPGSTECAFLIASQQMGLLFDLARQTEKLIFPPTDILASNAPISTNQAYQEYLDQLRLDGVNIRIDNKLKGGAYIHTIGSPLQEITPGTTDISQIEIVLSSNFTPTQVGHEVQHLLDAVGKMVGDLTLGSPSSLERIGYEVVALRAGIETGLTYNQYTYRELLSLTASRYGIIWEATGQGLLFRTLGPISRVAKASCAAVLRYLLCHPF